ARASPTHGPDSRRAGQATGDGRPASPSGGDSRLKLERPREQLLTRGPFAETLAMTNIHPTPKKCKATGTLVRIKSGPNKGCWQPVLRLVDGSRKRLPPFTRGTSEAMARAKLEA